MRKMIFSFAALLVVALPLFGASTQAKSSVLPFIENDYAKAIATAKSKNVPIFVDAWAPW